METKEECGTTYVCDVCGKVIANKCNLKRHKLMHTGFNESVKCEICLKTLSSEGNLKRHMRMHTGSQERQACNACCKSFSNVGNLRRHLRTHQSPGVQYECKLCNKCFPFEDYLKKHVRTVHGLGDVKRKSESSSTLPHIESFIKREEDCMEDEEDPSENEETDVCVPNNDQESLPPCKQEPDVIPEIKEELEVKDSPPIPSESLPSTEAHDAEIMGQDLMDKLCPIDKCSICKQVVTNPAEVNLDMWRMHLDTRMEKKNKMEKYSFDYNCSVCGKFLSNKGNLKRHMLLLHKKDLTGRDVDTTVEQMRSECHICGRMVANRGNLKRHIEKVHLKRMLGSTLDLDQNPTNISVTQPVQSPPEIKVEPSISVEEEPPVKKRRDTGESVVTVLCAGEECIETKPTLKVRIKTTPQIPNTVAIPIVASDQPPLCMDLATICNDPTCPEFKKQALEAAQEASILVPSMSAASDTEIEEKKEQITANDFADNSGEMKSPSRWRSQSCDETSTSPPDSPGKNGVCAAQCGENHSCPTCKRRFLCEDNFKKHLKRHRVCKMPKPLDTRPRMEGINEESSGSLLCHLCGQIMPFTASLQQHLQVVHGTAPAIDDYFAKLLLCFLLQLHAMPNLRPIS